MSTHHNTTQHNNSHLISLLLGCNSYYYTCPDRWQHTDLRTYLCTYVCTDVHIILIYCLTIYTVLLYILVCMYIMLIHTYVCLCVQYTGVTWWTHSYTYHTYILQLIHLLVGLCQCLSYEPSPAKDSVVHVPSSERADLIRERRKVCRNVYWWLRWCTCVWTYIHAYIHTVCIHWPLSLDKRRSFTLLSLSFSLVFTTPANAWSWMPVFIIKIYSWYFQQYPIMQIFICMFVHTYVHTYVHPYIHFTQSYIASQYLW